MAEKNNNNGVQNKNKNNDTNNNDGGEKKEDGSIASKIVKRVKPFQGAESVKSEGQANKLTVVRKVDPTKLRDELATKTKNKVDLVSPQPKKDNKVNNGDTNDTKKKQPEKTDDEKQTTKSTTKFTMYGRNLAMTWNYDNDDYDGSDSSDSNNGNDGNDDNHGNHGNHGNDRNDGNGGGGGVEKKFKEDEGNGGGEMKYPAGQSQFGQFSYGKGCRHSYGYQNGALKTGEKNVYCAGSRGVKRDMPNRA